MFAQPNKQATTTRYGELGWYQGTLENLKYKLKYLTAFTAQM